MVVFESIAVCRDPQPEMKEFISAIYRSGILIFEDQYIAVDPRPVPPQFLQDTMLANQDIEINEYYFSISPSADNWESYERLIYHLQSYGFPSEFRQVPQSILIKLNR